MHHNKIIKYTFNNRNYKKIKNSCGERGSNTRPSDLQSDALPTELSPLAVFYNHLLMLSLKNPNRASGVL